MKSKEIAKKLSKKSFFGSLGKAIDMSKILEGLRDEEDKE